jgi:hypothetical protein
MVEKLLSLIRKAMENQEQTLKELRASIKEIDAMRLVKELTDPEREALELTAVALRDAERLCIAKMQNQLIKDLQAQTASLNEQAKIIRDRVTKMNKLPKVLDNIETVIKIAVKIVFAITKW